VPDSPDDVPLLGQGLTWEDMTAGSSFRTASRTITESDLMSFVHLAGFNEPLFYDASHAAAGGYTGRLVPGALVYVLAEGLVIQTNVLHGTGLAFMHMDFSVKAPTYVGDTLHVVVTTTESRASSRPGRGVVTSRCAVLNQHGTEVAVFTPVRLIRGRNFKEAADSHE
jgi:acyl dehydratase